VVLATEDAAAFPDDFRGRTYTSFDNPASIAAALHSGDP
jgi:hypothetical protein